MVRYQDEDEREKVSWREIDRRKDRSPYAPKEPRGEHPPSQMTEWRKKQYRKQADRLFLGKKGTKKHDTAIKNIERHHGTEKFEEEVKSYLDQYGLPDDWRILSLLLDCSGPETVMQALGAMKGLFAGRTEIEKRSFKSKLDILAMTASDSDLRETAEEILKNL